MSEVWAVIEEFPNYSVSNRGRVRNDDTGRIMVLTRNQRGIYNVGLVRGGLQYKRSVAVLVATYFVEPLYPEKFDTPIHLDGDKDNLDSENLELRPRWFAIKYQKQFTNGLRGYKVPIYDTETKEVYPTSWEAATQHGLLDREILFAMLEEREVWPTRQVFKLYHPE